MKIKKLLYYITPPILFNKLNVLLKSSLKENVPNHAEDLVKLHTIISDLRSDEIYILGNAPSLQDQDLTKLYGKTIFLCNLFYKHELFENLKNNAKVVYFAMEPIETFVKNAFTLKIDLNTYILNHLTQFLSPIYYSIVSKSVYKYINENRLFTDCKIDYYDDEIISIYIEKYLLKELGLIKEFNVKVATKIRHTPNAMITYSILSRTPRIILLGLQHDYILQKLKNYSDVPHFYEGDINYVEPINKWELTDLFLNEHITFDVYREQSKLARLCDVHVMDATRNGMLDMFEKTVF
jgi:hypothetical protein